MKWIFIPALLLATISACKRDVDELPLERTFVREFYVQGEWRDTNQTQYTSFDYTVGKPVIVSYDNTYTCKSFAIRQLDGRKAIYSEILGTSTKPLFSIYFPSAAPIYPSANPAWLKTELDTFFVPGREFSITGAPGDPVLGLELPGAANSFFLNSLSDSKGAPTPGGRITVLSVNDFEWMSGIGLGDPAVRKGKQVTISFEAKLGRLGIVNGIPQVVGEAEVRNGEATLFFEY